VSWTGISVVAVALFGGVAAPVVTGMIQTIKARFQGRRGPSPLQPYRELRRLWGKSTVDPDGSSIIYRLAPAVAATAMASCLLVVATVVTAGAPLGDDGQGAWLGSDFLLVIGLLALGRFAVALSAWDTDNGFGLLGAARDLFIAVSAEAVMLLALTLAALPAASTDLRLVAEASAGTSVWQTPTMWCASVAFGLVALTEMGRQPVDNPDTHLELTMIHEGPLLEYAGRDLATLQWAAAARHVVVLMLLVGIFLPHGGSFPLQVAEAVGWFVVASAAVAIAETALAKMRLMRVPAYLGAGLAIEIIGLAAWFLLAAQ